MKLSKRLQLLADVIQKHLQGNTLADIGSDHAYLPSYLVKEGIIKKAYACDITEGPIQSAKETIHYYGLDDQVFAIMGPGLLPIIHKHVDMIAIAGMGAYLISDILQEHLDYAKKVPVLFLQPNANVDHLRSYLFQNGFTIMDEEMVKDGNHIYEVLVVSYAGNKGAVYSVNDIEFGPVLKRECSPLFKEKWRKQSDVYKKIQSTLHQEHPKYIELQDKIKRIEGVLNDC
ncbi:tRNA (adenine(22)-N(1))-methyltransferase [Tannockella kyphosi]|uniref:tRNA (adenine(22)-N(1))-methyltransferase n=1 Tax=Tannockella kyphosi TaxID=2899121 RepID=UPI002011BEDD|nr:class I SAM-dependent methyltransferase [Tannockella kyphosi]